ncbi:MAG: hypothetical protein JWQ25_1792 [Daejeonella sp.]|nr:hypothetical protein [Daejeonella sp.]
MFNKRKVLEKSNSAVQGIAERKEEVFTSTSNGSSGSSAISKKPTDLPEKPAIEAEPKEEIIKENQSHQPDEIKPIIKPALNLDATLKVVNDLHRRSIQRENLLNRIHQLESFEITLMEEGDELESNHFQGCQLIINDDKGRKFITQTAGLIKLVAEFITLHA